MSNSREDPLRQMDSDVVEVRKRSKARFPQTRWGRVVLAARHRERKWGTKALEALCAEYSDPIYAFVRQCGYSRVDAEELSNDFIAHLASYENWERIKVKEGKFRTFIIRSLKRFLINWWHHERAQKRGGSVEHVSSDEGDFEVLVGERWGTKQKPDEYFDREWALATIATATAALESEYSSLQTKLWGPLKSLVFAKDRTNILPDLARTLNSDVSTLERALTDLEKFTIFKALRPYLLRDMKAGVYAELSEKLDVTTAKLSKDMERLKAKFKAVLKEAIADTLPENGNVQEEYSYLMSVLSSQILRIRSSVLPQET